MDISLSDYWGAGAKGDSWGSNRQDQVYLQESSIIKFANKILNFIRYQQQLDEQMKIQELEREKVFQQFLKEKEMIDKVGLTPVRYYT